MNILWRIANMHESQINGVAIAGTSESQRYPIVEYVDMLNI